jgi:23S rRNA pseudouridine2605 synthase
MPRDRDKDNGRPPRRDRGAAGKGRPGAGPRDRSGRDERPARAAGGRGGDRPFGDKRPAGGKRPYAKPGDRKPYAGKSGGRSEGFRKDGDRPVRSRTDRDERSQRDERPARFNREDRPRKDFGARGDRAEGRPFKPRERSEGRPERAAGAGRFGEKRSYAPRGEGRDARPARFNRDEQREARPRFDRDDRGGRPAGRGPRKDFGRGEDRGNDKPWEKRAPRDDAGRSERPRFSRPRDDRPERAGGADRGPRKFDRPREERSGQERPDRERKHFDRPRFDKPREDRAPRARSDWQEHPRSERPPRRGTRDERPRRDNEDDAKIFVRRPAFGGRGDYRERKPDDRERRAPRAAAPEKKTKTGERIAKIVARAGLCSRREAEDWITQGRVAVNGRVITSPALDVTARDVVTIDGKPLPERERTRLFLYHKPRGLMTTHDDPEGRPTVFDNLPEGLPRLISIGRLDFNTEGLLLLTNDGGVARALELPDTGWLRRYRVRAHGEVTQAQLDALKQGVEVDGVKYGPIDATLEREQGANVWITFAIREGKNREVRNVMAHLGLEVNRLIRISYGPFQLGEIPEGQVEEIKFRVLREQLGEKIAAMSGAVFDKPAKTADDDQAPRGKGRVKPAGKSALIADRKGRRVLVQRAGSEEARARNENESGGYGPPRRPTRGYKGKRDLKPRDE